MRGFSHVKIVAADDLPVAHNMIVKDILRDPELYHAVDVVGFVVRLCLLSYLSLFFYMLTVYSRFIDDDV
jgi:hypothetical protein